MANLTQIQQEFMALLLNNERQLEQQVIPQGQLSQQQRVDIYRNGYRIRLRGVLESDHDILGRYLGDTLFNQMVEGYIDAYPSQHPSLRYFGDKLPQFLRETAPFNEHPILAEMAAFERILLVAFDAADANALTTQVLGEIPAEQWPVLVWDFHPSLQCFSCRWNSVESWQALKSDKTPPAAAMAENEQHWAIWRSPQNITEFASISAIESQILVWMQEQKPFADVCELAQQLMAADQVAEQVFGYLQQWLQRGWLIKVTPNATAQTSAKQ